MSAIVLAVLKMVELSAPYIQLAIDVGTDVAPFVSSLRNALTEIGSPDVVDTAEFKAAQEAIAPFEAHIQEAAARASSESEG